MDVKIPRYFIYWYFSILHQIKDGVRYIFQTRYDLTMVIPTLENDGVEAAIYAMRNLAEPKETVILAINGLCPINEADIAGTYVIRTDKPFGDVFTLEDIELTLKKHKPALLYLVLGESSTGTLQPMEGIGDLCHRYDCLLVLNCASAVAVVPVYTNKWGVDVVIGSSVGGLSSPPGLTPIAFSPRAVKKMNLKSPDPVPAITLGKKWGCLGGELRLDLDINTPPPLHLYYALREGLAVVVEEGLENVWERHRTCQQLLMDGLKRFGVDFFIQNENLRFPGITTISLSGTDLKLVHNYMSNRNCTVISRGEGSTLRDVLKIKILGYNAHQHIVEHVLTVLGETVEYARRVPEEKNA
ncbi:alanine--glyoxylate aminotransferase isoform X3 [Anabrus simplex]|uniref:alanine--glyoxylate aminotransferase isoform X3 n=1 Tax=Anabrus simplex TaxID=316456 RepID=UPI0035A2EDAD